MPKRKPWIVCAACKTGDFIAAGPRHFDDTMHKQIDAAFDDIPTDWEQGFIDQYGEFYTREEAAKIVKENNQPFDAERNGPSDAVLYSEGLY